MRVSHFVIVGRYLPNDTIIYRLDPRTKILFMILFVGLIFYANNIASQLILMGVILLGVLLARIPFTFILKGLLPIVLFLVFTTFIHLFTVKTGDIIYNLGFITIYSDGLKRAATVSLRLILIILSSSILTITTSPIDITMGLERIMSPLKLVKVPVRDIAFMMSISLRFIPILLEEADIIIKSQEARGANIFYGPLKKKISSILSIMVPLFINSMRRADQLAIAMEARGYRGSIGRTRMNTKKFTTLDLVFIPLSIFMIIIILQVRG